MIASVAPSGDPASIWSARRHAPARCLHECGVAKQFLMDGDLMVPLKKMGRVKGPSQSNPNCRPLFAMLDFLMTATPTPRP
jgi:hypothetical protein